MNTSSRPGSDFYTDAELASAYFLGMSVEELRKVLLTYQSYFDIFEEIRISKENKGEGK